MTLLKCSIGTFSITYDSQCRAIMSAQTAHTLAAEGCIQNIPISLLENILNILELRSCSDGSRKDKSDPILRPGQAVTIVTTIVWDKLRASAWNCVCLRLLDTGRAGLLLSQGQSDSDRNMRLELHPNWQISHSNQLYFHYTKDVFDSNRTISEFMRPFFPAYTSCYNSNLCH